MKRKGNKKYKYIIFVIYDAIYQELIIQPSEINFLIQYIKKSQTEMTV